MESEGSQRIPPKHALQHTARPMHLLRGDRHEKASQWTTELPLLETPGQRDLGMHRGLEMPTSSARTCPS